MLARTFGCACFVFNWGLRQRMDAYFDRHERLGYVELSAQLTQLNQQADTAWLTGVSSVPLQQALRHLDRAFPAFSSGEQCIQPLRRSMAHKPPPTPVLHSPGTLRPTP
jgi:putative transposase